MDKLYTSHRRRLLKVWLIAIACQAGQLFSQPHFFPYEEYGAPPSPEVSWFAPEPMFNGNMDYPSYYHPQADYWQPPKGISQEQVQSVIHPDRSLEYYSPQPQAYDSADPRSSPALEVPQDGQWPAFSNNPREYSQEISYDNNQLSSSHSTFEPSSDATNSYSPLLEVPQDGQWPAFSNNQQEYSPSTTYDGNQSTSAYPHFEAYLNWTTDNDVRMAEPSWSSPHDPSTFGDWNKSFDHSDYQDNTSSAFSPLSEQPAATYSPSSTEQQAVERPNLVTFDLPANSSEPREDHPLTKEGHAVSYPFQDESSEAQSPSENGSSMAAHSEEPDQEATEESAEDQEALTSSPQTVPNLSQGKGQVKIIKKASAETSAQNQKKASEHVIGKQIIADPVVGAIDKENKKTPRLDAQPTAKAATSLSTTPSSVNSSKLHTLAELMAQTSPENQSSPQETPNLDRAATASEETSSIAQAAPVPRAPTIITPTSPGPVPAPAPASAGQPQALKEISINFNNVAMIEYIRFISRISNKNFIFDDEELQFNVTIVSEEPTTVENLMAALLQELKIRDLSIIEQGNNIIIHRNPRVRSPARIVADGTDIISSQDSELVTRVFRLNTLDPIKASEIIRPLLSEDSLVEVLRDTNNLIITDLVTNVNKIAQLIGTLDAPNSGITIGQFVVRNAFVDSLVDLATKILQPIAQGNPFVLVPHPVSNSIFIVSNAFIVEKALAILQNLDLNEGRTKILSLEGLRPTYQAMPEGMPAGAPAGAVPGVTPGGVSVGIPGVTAPGAVTPGVLAPEGFGLGRIGPGAIAPGAVTPGAVTPGAITPGVIAPGAVTPGAIRPGAFTPETGVAPGQLGIPGIGPGGQVISPEAMPESFPLGGIGVEGRVTPVGPGGVPLAPGGIGVEGRPSAIFDERTAFLPGGIGAATRFARELPHGHIERTLFFIHKLRFRRGDQIENALRRIGNSLQAAGTANPDLIAAINSSQWIESSNALIFTGTAIALEKVSELILELDVPLRQVFIEMLILDTTITDSLSYSVDWANRFGGGSTTGEQGFIPPGSLATSPSVANFLNTVEGVNPPLIPPATGLLNSEGFNAGVIGTHLTHNGLHFSTIGALVRAIHAEGKANILLNPKIITEDNNTAEIFVGGTDRYKTQSITNDLGTLVTNNFQFIDVGTTLRVTPLIGNNGIITLEIIQETTNASPNANSTASANQQDVNLVEVLTKSRTVTKIHVPNGFFVVLSGMINNNETRTDSRIPCLGGIPILGGFGRAQTNNDIKRNLMLFIRPFIIDTDEDLEDVTRRQQDVYREKSKLRREWNFEIDEGLNFLNIRPTDPDEIGCNER
jgi:type III secretion protein C